MIAGFTTVAVVRDAFNLTGTREVLFLASVIVLPLALVSHVWRGLTRKERASQCASSSECVVSIHQDARISAVIPGRQIRENSALW